MKIKTVYDPPPIPLRDRDWCAWDEETCHGDSDQFGWGATEEEAIRDLIENVRHWYEP